MKPLKLNAVLLPLILFSVSVAYADNQSNSKKKDVLSVRIVPPEQPVAPETRVALTVKIKNVSAREINLPWSKYINQFIKTESADSENGKPELTVRHNGLALGHGKYPGSDLRPGDEITVEIWHIFPTAGRHSLQCVLETSRKGTPWTFWEGRVESTSIAVNVKTK